MIDIPSDQIWMIVVGFLIAFILAFGIGANDVANSFGTSVGAKVLTMRQACILASIFETLGAILLGAKVSDTIRKGIISIEPYTNNTELLMVGNVAALSGSCAWLMAATLLRMPVSATHSIVGATVGFALVAHGSSGINWTKLGMIIGSWFISPVLAGLVSTALFYVCKYFILSRADPLEPGLRFLPVFYATTVVVNLFSVFYDGPEMLGFDKIPLWGTFIISFGSGVIVTLVVRFAIVPWQRRKIKEECAYTAAVPPVKVIDHDDNFKISNNKAYPVTNSEDGASEKAVLAAATVIEMENQENHKNRSCSISGATNLMPPNISSKILTEITHPAPDKNANNTTANLKPGVKPGINKREDAPLMDNEYRLGTSTPTNKPPNTEEVAAKVAAKVAARLETGKVQTKDTPDNLTVAINTKKAAANETENLKEVSEADLSEGRSQVIDRPETAQLFSFLQILTAVFGSFAHGGNDVSNAIGPLVSLWLIGVTGTVSAKAATPIWILFYGGVGISIGLWIWGRRVIKTLGEDLTKITPSSGFCIEIGSALTVLVASNIGIPISTTHCKVGSVVFVGRFRARENVDWKIFRNIVLAWVVTLPVTGGISAAMMAILMKCI